MIFEFRVSKDPAPTVNWYLENKIATFGMALEHHSAISNSTLNKLKSMTAAREVEIALHSFFPSSIFLLVFDLQNMN